MRAGKLDRTITLQTYSEGVPDDYGNSTPGFADTATLRAQIVQASTEEYLWAYGEGSQTAVIFRTRYLEGVGTEDRVVYEGKPFNIKEVKEIGRRRGLELRCEGADE